MRESAQKQENDSCTFSPDTRKSKISYYEKLGGSMSKTANFDEFYEKSERKVRDFNR